MSTNIDQSDDTNYFSSLKYGRDEGVGQDVFVDVSDAAANYKKFIISFMHLGSSSTVNFKAFVTEYNESFNCSWTPTEVYGRTDPIQNYKGTSRTVSLAFDVPASSVGEAYENLGRISRLVQMLYPSYTSNDISAGRIIGQAPLIRVKMMNLITSERLDTTHDHTEASLELAHKAATNKANPDAQDQISPQELLQGYQTVSGAENGVLAAISSITYRTDLQKSQMFEKATNTVLPQALSVNLSFTVIHEETLGWEDSHFIAPSYPHKVLLLNPSVEQQIGSDQNPANIAERIRSERDNQAEVDARRAARGRLFGALGGLGRGASQVAGGNNYGQSDIPLFGEED